jgi:hypothetical protein
MPETPLARLRRHRRRICAQLRKLEPLVADYQAKLARIEARMQELDPQLWMPPRHYRPNPVFARGELPRLAMTIMRRANRPMGTLDIAMRALALKGVTQPGPGLRKLIRTRMVQTLGKWAKRGLVVRVGRGKATRSVLLSGGSRTPGL